MAERFDWERATARERDAEIAVRLFGWRWLLQAGSGGYPVAVAVWPPDAPGRVLFNLRDDAQDVAAEHWKYERFSDWDRMAYRDEGDSMHGPLRVLPHYTTDAAADYEVLRHVRENWESGKVCAFRDALKLLWECRADEFNKNHSSMNSEGVYGPNQYIPGDYSRAALAVVEESNG